MKVEVDRGGCIGCGVCAQVCPEVFRIADDGLSEVNASPDGFEAKVEEAAEACPVDVISVDSDLQKTNPTAYPAAYFVLPNYKDVFSKTATISSE